MKTNKMTIKAKLFAALSKKPKTMKELMAEIDSKDTRYDTVTKWVREGLVVCDIVDGVSKYSKKAKSAVKPSKYASKEEAKAAKNARRREARAAAKAAKNAEVNPTEVVS